MQQRENFPQLFQLAKEVLIIPASNTYVERIFSVSGATVTEKRTRLSIEKIDKIMFLKKNLAYLKSLRESNQKGSPEDTADPLSISSKRTLSTDLSQSLQTKKRRLSTDDAAMFNEQYEQMQSDDDDGDYERQEKTTYLTKCTLELERRRCRKHELSYYVPWRRR
ncbi:unnamed protein product [Rotaria sp. Silwood1]|nr:unnamed protein product [Rotaria sp. Silwood1]